MAPSADTLTIGDRVTLVARLAAPRGSRVSVVLLRSDTAAVEVIDGPRVATAADGTHALGVRVAVWAVGEVAAPVLRATAVSPDGRARSVDVPLRVPHVRSVLPPDSARVAARGPKDVVELRQPAPYLAWLRFALAAAAVVALALILVRRLRRRARPRSDSDARAEALAALRGAAEAGWIERGDARALYIAVAGAVRGYASHLSPRWGGERTTDELAREMTDAGAPPDDVAAISAVLRRADLVKFARHRPTPQEAAADLAAARAWVERAAPPIEPGGAASDRAPDAEVAA
jgi:hypothetical protein